MMRFAIDERSINLNGMSTIEAKGLVENFLLFLDEIIGSRHGVCYDNDLFLTPIREDLSFWDLFGPDAELQLSHDDLDQAVAIFGTMPRWDDLQTPQPRSFEVHIADGVAETSGSVAWVHAQASNTLLAPACISVPGRRNCGRHPVVVAGESIPIWFVCCSRDIEAYFRDLLSNFAKEPDDFASFAVYAFPNLIFLNKCFDGIKRMGGQFRDLRFPIVQHLSAFSDFGQSIFFRSWQNAPSAFGSLGVDVSDENGFTKRDNEAASERMRIVDGTPTYFWWHSKIEPHRNRIHISPDGVAIGGKIIVGIFCLHLK